MLRSIIVYIIYLSYLCIMDLLYIVSHSNWNDNELRYSLRSIEKYASNVGRVFVCGDIPTWLSDEVVKIPCNNPYPRKAKNILYKVMYAIDHSDIGNEFLMSSDDIFHIRPIDLDNYPHYWKNGDIISVPEELKNKRIGKIIDCTVSILKRFGYPLEDYGGGHCLHHVDAAILRNMPKIREASMQSEYGCVFDSMMGGAIYMLKHPEEEIRYDVKVDVYENEEELLQIIGDSTCFSIDDESFQYGMREYLKKLYQNKSKYER